MVAMPFWPKKLITISGAKDLSRIETILTALNNPHLKIPPTIHVAGTNGKGSSCAMLRAIFEAAKYKVHMYTSPHLIDFNERIILAGQKIDDDLLFEYMNEIKEACEKIEFEPTLFEATTACAFLAFSKNYADIVILETGVGGRLDPTNVVPKPLRTLITPISYDHMDILGDTIEQIASEKAGIIKHKVPCIISRQDQRVMDVLLGKCLEVESFSIAYEYDFIPSPEFSAKHPFKVYENSNEASHSLSSGKVAVNNQLMLKETSDIIFSEELDSAINLGVGQPVIPALLETGSRKNDEVIYHDKMFSYQSQMGDMDLPLPNLAGHHQIINASSVVALIQSLRAEFNIGMKSIREGLTKINWPGRIQKVSFKHILNKDKHGWVDGAHNISGAAILSEWIRTQNFAEPVIIVGMTKNRDVASFLIQFKNIKNLKIYATSVASEASSYSGEKLASLASGVGIDVISASSIIEAIELANKNTNNANIIITGSLFLVADFLKYKC